MLSFFTTALATSLRHVDCHSAGGRRRCRPIFRRRMPHVADITPPEQRARRLKALGSHRLASVYPMVCDRWTVGPRSVCACRSMRLAVSRCSIFCMGTSCCRSRCRSAAGTHLPGRPPIRSVRCAGSAQLEGLAPAGRRSCLHRTCPVRALYLLGAVHHFQPWLGAAGQPGWSLAAVGVVSAIVQGLLVGPDLCGVSSVRRLGGICGLISSTLAYALWGAGKLRTVG